jgi:hypothetical protein
MNSAIRRAEGYGFLGPGLVRVLQRHPDVIESFGQTGFVSDLARLHRDVIELQGRDFLLPIAISLCVLDFPLQLPIHPGHIREVLRQCGGLVFQALEVVRSRVLPKGLKALKPEKLARKFAADKGLCLQFFAPKPMLPAERKLNMATTQLIASAVRCGEGGTIGKLILALAGMVSEDQFQACFLYGLATQVHYGVTGWDIAIHFILNPELAKSASTVFKALGANCTQWGAVIVEAVCLQGRGSGPIDLRREKEYRTDAGAVEEKVVQPDMDLMERCIKEVLLEELGPASQSMMPFDDWWTSRWLWCVNGSHTRASSDALGIDHNAYDHTHTRFYRRMAAETVDTEPVTSWDTRVSVSASIKQEAGKQRAIFACDTRSYFAFSWLMQAVEPRWRNSHVLLNPGKGGLTGICHRVKNAQRGGGVNLMLDYDDFNSHHSTAVMQLLTRITCEHVGAPNWYKHKLVASFDNTWLDIDGRPRHIAGTLMSGHRLTTYINSVLNRAYLKAAVGSEVMGRTIALHAGDDVYMRVPTLADCATILERAKAFGCRMNPTKQSIGFVGAEFLRLAIGRTGAYGYVARSIATFVAGNWATEDLLKPDDALICAINGVRTLINRSGTKIYPRMVAPALRYIRGVPVRTLIRLLSGEAALEGSPVYDKPRDADVYRVVRDFRLPEEITGSWARNATRDYLSHHVSEVEVRALELCRSTVVDTMVASSFSKGLNQDTAGWPATRIQHVAKLTFNGFTSVSELMSTRIPTGCLAQYPLIRLVASRLTNDDLRELIVAVGGNAQATDLRAEAFGRETTTKNVQGVLPFSDAATFSKRTTAGNIVAFYYIYS